MFRKNLDARQGHTRPACEHQKLKGTQMLFWRRKNTRQGHVANSGTTACDDRKWSLASVEAGHRGICREQRTEEDMLMLGEGTCRAAHRGNQTNMTLARCTEQSKVENARGENDFMQYLGAQLRNEDEASWRKEARCRRSRGRAQKDDDSPRKGAGAEDPQLVLTSRSRMA